MTNGNARCWTDREMCVHGFQKICGNHGRENANVYPRKAAARHAGRGRRMEAKRFSQI